MLAYRLLTAVTDFNPLFATDLFLLVTEASA
jgi:hypothetical protein